MLWGEPGNRGVLLSGKSSAISQPLTQDERETMCLRRGICPVLLAISWASFCPVAAGHVPVFTTTRESSLRYTPGPQSTHGSIPPAFPGGRINLWLPIPLYRGRLCLYITCQPRSQVILDFSEDLVIQSTPMALHSPVTRPRSAGSRGAEAWPVRRITVTWDKN